MFEVRSVAANVGPYIYAVFRVRADQAGQGKQFDRCCKVQLLWLPFLGHRLARWFFVVVRHFAALCVGAKASFVDPDVIACVFTQQLTFRWDSTCFSLGVRWAEGAGVFAFGVA